MKVLGVLKTLLWPKLNAIAILQNSIFHNNYLWQVLCITVATCHHIAHEVDYK